MKHDDCDAMYNTTLTQCLKNSFFSDVFADQDRSPRRSDRMQRSPDHSVI